MRFQDRKSKMGCILFFVEKVKIMGSKVKTLKRKVKSRLYFQNNEISHNLIKRILRYNVKIVRLKSKVRDNKMAKFKGRKVFFWGDKKSKFKKRVKILITKNQNNLT